MAIDERRHWIKASISIAAVLAVLAASLALLGRADGVEPGSTAASATYRLGDWPVPFAIVLVLDRLTALMLVLTGVLGLAAAVFALARWHVGGLHFHSMFQVLLMGVNGAFLTGDLFNLFVFFELLLAASYGLALHGSGHVRVRAALHYVAINLTASLVFLIGISLIYGVTGTLNMADISVRIAAIADEDRMLVEAGAALLGITFLLKAGMWPLSFWLPPTYTASAAPIAALFTILSKVGVYAILRMWLLFFGEASGVSSEFGGHALLLFGLATIAFGAIGVLAAQSMRHLTAYSVLVSSGTIIAAIPAAQADVTGAALFYLVSSTLGLAALFMLVEVIERGLEPAADMLAVTREAYGDDEDSSEEQEIGIAFPATTGFLGLCFAGCALVVAGLPPLSGFIAKFAVLSSLFGSAAGAAVPSFAWAILAALMLSGLASLIAMARAGIRTFWTPEAWTVPRIRVVEMTPIVVLLLGCIALTAYAEPAMRFMHATAEVLHAPDAYVRSVLPGAGAPVQESRR